MTDDNAIRRETDRRHDAEVVARMLTEALRRWSGFRFRLHCPSCRDNREIELSTMVARYGDWTIQRVVESFKCRVCGQAPDEISVRHHVAVYWMRGEQTD